MSILDNLRYLLILEGQRNVEIVKRLPKFKNVPDNVFDSLKEQGFEQVGNGSYLEWILGIYLKSPDDVKKRFIEDLYKLKEDLEKFNILKNKQFWKSSKDINQYKSFKDLFDAVRLHQDLKSKSDLKVKKSSVDNKDYNLVYENSNWKIYSPLTKEASCILGRDTRWCTASQGERNMFDYYNRKGKLFILINKQDEELKYQFHFESGQFMDVNDDQVEGLKLDDDIIDFFLNLDYKKYKAIISFANKDKIIKELKDKTEKEVKDMGIWVFDKWQVIELKNNNLVIGKFNDSKDLEWGIPIKDSRDNSKEYIKMLDDLLEVFYYDDRDITSQDIIDRMNRDVYKKFDKYASDNGYNGIDDYLEHEDDDKEQLIQYYIDANRYGTENDAYNRILKDLGEVNDMGMWLSKEDDGNYYLYSDGTGLGESRESENYGDGFEIDIPYYGFSGFDKDYYNKELTNFIENK